MALIVEGKMPKNCARCERWSICPNLNDFKDYESILENDVIGDGGSSEGTRDKNCPIKGEIPDEHGRLIDADDLIEEIREAVESQKTGDAIIDSAMAQISNEFIGIITNTPTVVEASDGK